MNNLYEKLNNYLPQHSLATPITEGRTKLNVHAFDTHMSGPLASCYVPQLFTFFLHFFFPMPFLSQLNSPPTRESRKKNEQNNLLQAYLMLVWMENDLMEKVNQKGEEKKRFEKSGKCQRSAKVFSSTFLRLDFFDLVPWLR